MFSLVHHLSDAGEVFTESWHTSLWCASKLSTCTQSRAVGPHTPTRITTLTGHVPWRTKKIWYNRTYSNGSQPHDQVDATTRSRGSQDPGDTFEWANDTASRWNTITRKPLQSPLLPWATSKLSLQNTTKEFAASKVLQKTTTAKDHADLLEQWQNVQKLIILWMAELVDKH